MPEISILTPQEFAQRLSSNQEALTDSYLGRLREEIPGAKQLTREYLKDHLPNVIEMMIEFLKSDGKQKDYIETTLLANIHGKQRAKDDTYTVSDLRQEYAILREVLLVQLGDHEALAPRATNLFGKVIESCLSHSTEIFLRNSASEMISHRNERKESAKNLKDAVDDRASAENQRKWFELALNRLPKPVFIMDLKDQIVSFSNEAAKKMLGVTYQGTRPTDTYGHVLKMTDAIGNPLSGDEIPSSRVFRGERLEGAEVKLTGPGGKYHIKAFSEHLPEAYGFSPSSILLLQDITTLKQTEAELLKVQQDLNEAVDLAQIGFWQLDPQTQLISVTPLLMKQFGLSPENFKSTLAEAIAAIHVDDQARVLETINSSMLKKKPYHIEYRVVHPNGDVHWIEANGGGTYDAKGNATRFTGTTIDVTEKVIARKHLEKSTEEMRLLADSMPQIVWAAMANGDLDYFNEVWFRYSNSNFAQNTGKGWTQFVHPDDLALTAERWQKSIASGTSYENEFRLRKNDGNYRWHVSRAVPIFENGKIRKWYGTNTDIHDQKILNEQLEEAKQSADRANAAKSQFLANMSHEIRTPLGAIMGFASLVKETSIGKAEREGYLSVIERNSSQLLRIIDDILDISKVEAGMMIIEQIEFSLPEMLTDFSSLMGFKAREKGILFISRAVTPLPKMIITDPTRLRQILINVVGNAIKFTEKGQVEMRVCYKDGILDFEIEDTGRGISDEQAVHLFQPFTQADTSITRKYGGTGLGLALSRNLSEALGGHFELKKSRVDHGSVFSVKVLAAVKPGTESVTGLGFEIEPVRSVAFVGQLAGMKILLVEDSPDNQALISIYLGRAGARVDIASDGEQGHRMAISGDYHVVLMDVQMPILDGISSVRKMRTDGYKLPVIALTAHAMKEERIRCLNAGFSDFLSKPVSKEQLIETLLRYKH